MKILISRADGGVDVVTLIGNATIEDVLPKWQAARPGEYVSHREIAEADIPADRTFRNAWTDTGTITERADKVAEIQAERQKSEKLSATLDILSNP